MFAFRSSLYVIVVFGILFATNAGVDGSLGVNGGMGCAACTILVSMTQQLATVNNVSSVDYMSHGLCQMFQGQLNLVCGFLVTIWGQAVVEKLIRNESPDVICYSLGICRVDSGQQYCHLFPEPQGGIQNAVHTSRSTSKIVPAFPWAILEGLPDVCHLPGMQQVCDIIVGNVQSHLPSIDVDRDLFSVVESFRGSLWRGRDCNDFDSLVYPGRKPLTGDSLLDANCNGIMGLNESTGLSLEEELCLGDERGILYIGDSIGARFHIPEDWLIARQIDKNTFNNISTVLSNQFDWPQLGFSTGFRNIDWTSLTANVDSLYSRLRARNRCNHRDYQNISFNGAETNTMLPFLRSISRDKQRDKPLLVFFALLGNDVCKRYMTAPDDNKSAQDYRNYVMESLRILDQNLPNNSYVFLVGLVNGSFIYPMMHDRIHPIGQLNSDVTYAAVYDWWNCMHIGPCYGWMNSDPVYRNTTTELSKQFTQVLRDTVANEKFTSFTLGFLENPLTEVRARWQRDGKTDHSLLEPVDSMHPVQEAQEYITEIMWSELESKWPESLGLVNPNNVRIAELFGEQGGY